MPKPSYHVFVCTNQRPPGHPRGSCGEKNALAVLQEFAMGVESKMLMNKVFVSSTSCLGPCSMGPVVIVYPDAVWYNNVKPGDVEEILDQHIGKGQVVRRLAMPDNVWA